jgi:hypothetical protein
MSGSTTAAHALVELLRRRRCAPGSLVVDMAADAGGTLADALQGSGLLPLVVTADVASADRLSAAGVMVVRGAPSRPDTVFEDTLLTVAGRDVAAVWLGDLPARTGEVADLVRAAHRFAARTGALLAVGLPNVSHVDVGTKLLLGRWEPRPHGVLDDAHVRRFSATSLRSTMAALGWDEIDAEDIEVAESDQHFPADAVPLARTTPAGAQLAGLREMAGPGTYVTQLVRLYEAVTPGAAVSGAEGPARSVAAGHVAVPFLSVLVRTQGRRPETLL